MEELYDLKRNIQTLKDDYIRRINTANSLIADMELEPYDKTTHSAIERLKNKRDGYKRFLSDLMKLIK